MEPWYHRVKYFRRAVPFPTGSPSRTEDKRANLREEGHWTQLECNFTSNILTFHNGGRNGT